MQNDTRLERFRHLSPAKRALLLKKFTQQEQGNDKAPTIVPRQHRTPVALSFAQQQLFFLYLLDPSSPAYNVAISLRLLGPLQVDALIGGLQTIVQRHEILRTTIGMVDGQPQQMIAQQLTITPQIVDASSYSLEDQMQAVADEIATPFDLMHGPLLRAALLRVGEQEHLFILCMHHIVADGWSIGIVLRELNALYAAQVTGQPSPLLPLPIQYADYALWQREWLKGAAANDHLVYWRQQLAGAPTLLDLPVDHSRPAAQNYRGRTFSFQVPQSVRVALKSLSLNEGVTLFMTLLAAFQIVLYRYSGQEDFLVGTPIANRTRSETEGVVGCFINTLVLRSTLTSNLSFRSLLQHVRDTCLDAYAHQEVPFERIVEELQPRRDPGYNPLFQVMFILQNASGSTLDLPGLQIQPVEVHGDSAKFDITLSMTEYGQALEGVLEYNRDLFDHPTMERFVEHFVTILQSIVAYPARTIAELPWLTAQEEHYLLHEVNAPLSTTTNDASLSRCCLHELVAEQARRSPDAIALQQGSETLTYRAVELRATLLAARLRALGVGPEVLVGVCLPRSMTMVIGLLAVLKAGGAYVPLDPAYPEERLAFILHDTQIKVLLTQQTTFSHIATYQGIILSLDDWSACVPMKTEEIPASAVEPANLAYVIYTSGSTGRPKGVAITHASAVQLVRWAQRVYRQEELRAVLASTSICFDLSIFELFVPLSCGGRCVLVENALQWGMQLYEGEVTLVNTVPSVARELLNLGGLPATVQCINLAGEALPLAVVQRLVQETQVKRIYNLYGPSEDTTYSTVAHVPCTIAETPPIGRPIEGTWIYLLDQQRCLVPAGLSGEIYIGGEGLARGYLHRPDLTAERFVPDPYSGQPGARLYKTGDLARYRADGSIEFLGRLDDQVKVRGFRIELGEIETVLNAASSVRESVVVAQNDEVRGAYLAAFIILETDYTLNSDELRDFLQGYVPAYMVPSVFLPLKEFPLTPNGKIDRRALAAMQTSEAEPERTLIRPRDTIELQLLQIWEKALSTGSISVSDAFFDIGGHSLLAIHLMAQIQQMFEYKLPLEVLIQHGTIEHIAHLIREEHGPIQRTPLVALQTVGQDTPFFCVHPAGGSALCYIELARYFQRPFYGLQAEGLAQETAANATIEEMATCYITALQSVQPQGPYLIGGWSLGGVIALEIAQQLTRQGQEVALLTLIDTSFISSQEEVALPSQIDLFAGFALHLGLAQEQLQTFCEETSALPWNQQWAYGIQYMQDNGILPDDMDTLHVQRLFDLYQTIMQAWLQYRPRRYEGDTVLLKARNRTGHTDRDPTMGWENLVTADHLTVKDVPGDHYTLMRAPHVESLATQLQYSLNQASQHDTPQFHTPYSQRT
jgi:amino acid adenylation domain